MVGVTQPSPVGQQAWVHNNGPRSAVSLAALPFLLGEFTLRSQIAAVVSALLAVVVAAPPPTASALVAEVSGPQERVVVEELATPVAPGVTHHAFDFFDERGWVRGDALVVELDTERLDSDLLSAGPVTATAPLSQQAAQRDATGDGRTVVGAVNGDFFDINATGAPLGPAIAEGGLRHGPSGGSIGGSGQAAGVNAAGLGQLLEVALTGRIEAAAGDRPLGGLNQPVLQADEVGAYTSLWGDAPRAGAVEGADQVVEVLVRGDTVQSISTDADSGPIPAGGYVLLGREEGADYLGQLAVGDLIRLGYAPQTDPAGVYDWAVGGTSPPLVIDGQLQDLPDTGFFADTTLAPRTAIGFSADGGTAYLLTVDGRQSDSRGLSIPELADLMADLGADDVMNLDGGGSSTLLARNAGQAAATVKNSPSDGSERAVPNGVGILADAGSGDAAAVDLGPTSPDEDATRVLPGLTRQLTATGYDEMYGPAEVTPAWRVEPPAAATVSASGVVTPTDPGPLEIIAEAGPAMGSVVLDVVGPLDRVRTEPVAVPLADADTTGEFTVAGYDAEGYRVPIEPRDVKLTYDAAVVTITPDGRGAFSVVPQQERGSTVVKVVVGAASVALPVTVGLDQVDLDDFSEPDDWYTFTARASATLTPSDGFEDDSGLRLDYSFDESTGTRAAYVRHQPDPVAVPGQPRRIGLHVDGDGNGAWLRLRIVDAGGGQYTVDLARNVDWTGWQYVEAEVPDGVQYPIEVDFFYPVETVPEKQYDGSLAFDNLVALVPPSVDAPQPATPRDPIVAQNGFEGNRRLIAVMSDAQFTADDPDSEVVQLARQTLREIVASPAEQLIIVGDFTDRGRDEDFDLARQILQEEVGDALPWSYLPGNHESYEGTDDGGIGLQNFTEEFGETFSTLDFGATRLVLLNSALGGFRVSEYEQLPALRDLLADAAADPAIQHVALFSHYPPRDPLPADNSDLADPKESELVEEWLTDFERTSGKDAAFVGAGVGVFHAERVDGVPYLIVGNSGKGPSGGPANGGFTGWALLGIEADAAADGEWIEAQVNPRLEAIDIDAPRELTAGQSATVAITGVQDDGQRRFPLDWPASVDYSGSEGVFVGPADQADVQAVVAFDPVTDRATALRAGTATLVAAATTRRAAATITVTARPLPPPTPDPTPPPVPDPTPPPVPDPTPPPVPDPTPRPTTGPAPQPTVPSDDPSATGGSPVVIDIDADDEDVAVSLPDAIDDIDLVLRGARGQGKLTLRVIQDQPDINGIQWFGPRYDIEVDPGVIYDAIEMSLPYDPQEVADNGITEAELQIFRAPNDAGGADEVTTGVEPDADRVHGRVTSLSSFAVGAYRLDRLAGAERIATAVQLAQDWQPGVPTVFVASAYDFPDALAGGPAAARLGGPVLLTDDDQLPVIVAEELQRLQPERVVILGGQAAVSADVEEAVRQTTGTADRWAGPDRFATAARIAAEAFPTVPGGVETVYVATGGAYPDALSGGAAAARDDAPVLLVGDQLSEVVAGELMRLRPQRVIVLGGAAAVSDDVVAQLETITTAAVERLSGPDRFATAAAVAATFQDVPVPAAFVATGMDFPDALAGVPAAAGAAAPILLALPDGVPSVTAQALDRLDPDRVTLLGGVAALGQAVRERVEATLRVG